MPKNLPLFIGLRYLRGKRQNGFLSFVSGFSFGAMALGVAALIVVLSVMNGFANEIHSRVLNVIPHLTILDRDDKGLTQKQVDQLANQLNTNPSVVAASPFVEGYGMLKFDGEPQAVSIQGINPATEANVTPIAHHMLAGEFDLLQPGEFGIVLGYQTARAMRVVVGDQLRLTLPELSRTLAGVFPREKNVTVIGVFKVDAQVDGGIAFVNINDAQKLYRRGSKVDGLRVRLQQPIQARTMAAELQTTFDEQVKVSSWPDQMGSLFAAMEMEKVVVGLLLGIVIAVAGFNIVANLVLMVAEKRKDIAVLRSMGTRSNTIMRIFMVQGTAVGFMGILIGAVIGCAVGYWTADIVGFFERITGLSVFDPHIYFVSSLPSQLHWQDVVVVCTGALLMSMLATLYPAWRASRIEPAEALRYDH